MRTSAWTTSFWLNLYNLYNALRMSSAQGQEQGAINGFAEEHPAEFARHTAIVAPEVFNQHRLYYSEGDFVTHYAGWHNRKTKFQDIADDLADPKVGVCLLRRGGLGPRVLGLTASLGSWSSVT